jgi:hypothetical protein
MGDGARTEGDGGDPVVGEGSATVTEGVGWMPRSFVPKKDVA